MTPTQRISIRAAIHARLCNSIPTDDEAVQRFAATLGIDVPAILDGADPEPDDALWIVDRHGNPRMVCTPADEPTGKRHHSEDAGKPCRLVANPTAEDFRRYEQQERSRPRVQPVGLGWAPGDYREPEQEGEG